MDLHPVAHQVDRKLPQELTLFNLSAVAHHLQDRELAAKLYPTLQRIAEQVGVVTRVVCVGSFGFCAATVASTLGRWGNAELHFEPTLVMHERLARRAPSRCAPGGPTPPCCSTALRRATPRAPELVATALAEAEALGMARELTRLGALAERAAGR